MNLKELTERLAFAVHADKTLNEALQRLGLADFSQPRRRLVVSVRGMHTMYAVEAVCELDGLPAIRCRPIKMFTRKGQKEFRTYGYMHECTLMVSDIVGYGWTQPVAHLYDTPLDIEPVTHHE